MSKFNIPVQSVPTVASAYAEVLGNNSENQIIEIPNDMIIENNNQYFKIHDETIEQLAEDIAKDGQLSPCIVTPLSDGKYELIDGRHRRRAVIRAGLPTTKCIIRNEITDKQKTKIRITSNLFRNNDYLPSEIALSLKELVEIEGTHDAIKKISEETNTNRKKTYRYLRLTYLIKPLLDRVDSGNIPVIAAVELSYLTEQQQNKLFEFLLNHSDCKINTTTARMIKEDPENLNEIFYAPKPEEKEISENEQVDKLSTFTDIAVASTNVEEKFTEISDESVKEETDVATSNDKETCNIDDIPPEHRKLIAKAVIRHTKIDYYIIKKFYNTSEVLSYLNDKYISHYSGSYGNSIDGIAVSFDFHYHNRKFLICIDGTEYVMSHKLLENIIRIYIRNEYSIEDIINLLHKEL